MLPELRNLVNKGCVPRTARHHRGFHVRARRRHTSLGMIARVKDRKTKRRLILDYKESGVTDHRRGKEDQRIVLPDTTDLVRDVLKCTDCADVPEFEILVLDITEVVCALGLRDSERRYFAGRLHGIFYMYSRLAQRFRGVPLAWCRCFPLVSRLTQAMYEPIDVGNVRRRPRLCSQRAAVLPPLRHRYDHDHVPQLGACLPEGAGGPVCRVDRLDLDHRRRYGS